MLLTSIVTTETHIIHSNIYLKTAKIEIYVKKYINRGCLFSNWNMTACFASLTVLSGFFSSDFSINVIYNVILGLEGKKGGVGSFF